MLSVGLSVTYLANYEFALHPQIIYYIEMASSADIDSQFKGNKQLPQLYYKASATSCESPLSVFWDISHYTVYSKRTNKAKK